MPLYLDEIIALTEYALVQLCSFDSALVIGIAYLLCKFARDTPRKADKPLVVLSQQFKVYAGAIIEALCIAQRHQLYEVLIACIIFTQKYQVVGLALTVVLILTVTPRHIYLTAYYRLYARRSASVVKLYRREHIAVIGDRAGCLTYLFQPCHKVVYAACAVKQRIFGMQVQMHEISHAFHRLSKNT